MRTETQKSEIAYRMRYDAAYRAMVCGYDHAEREPTERDLKDMHAENEADEIRHEQNRS